MPTEAQHTFPMTNHHLSPHQPLGRPAESPEHISAEQDPHTGNAFDSSVHPDEDWIEVSDLAERGQIQNRVAQRNHRRKLTEHPVGFEESDYISWPEDRLVDEMFLELVQKHGWDMLPEQAKRQMIAYSSAKKWTLVYQDRLTESNSLVATDSYLASHIRYLGAESTKQEHASSMSASASPSQDKVIPSLYGRLRSYDGFYVPPSSQLTPHASPQNRRGPSAPENPELHPIVVSFVDILVREPSMDRLLAITTSELGPGPGRFARNFSTILKTYSRHLQEHRQAVEDGTKGGRKKRLIPARSIRNARHQVSNLIASRYNERVPAAQAFKHRETKLISCHLNQPVPENNDGPSSKGETSEDENGPRIGALKQVLLSGEPFRLLKRNLRSLVIPDEFLHCIYESARQFITLILTDKRSGFLYHGLLEEIESGRDIASYLSVQVRLMAAELKAECTDISQLDASIFLKTYSQYISVVAIERLKSPSYDLLDQSLKATIAQQDVLEQVVVDTLPSVLYVDLLPHRTFLASSSAFASFIDGLHDLVFPTFFSAARKSVMATIRSAETSEYGLLAFEGRHVLAILSEMQSCLQQSNTPISFSVNPSQTQMTALNSAKLAVEVSTASEWDWWPLQPPRYPWSAGSAELSWKCSCGTERRESTLPYYASELKRIFDNLNFPLSPGGSSEHVCQPPSSLSNTSSQGARSTHSSTSSSMSSGQSARSSSSNANSSTTPPDSVVDFSTRPRRYIYVFLLIKASEYTLDTIDVSSMKARDFFQTLRAAYIKHRGLLRRAFSVFVYNHCDFIKIIKPEPETFMPGELKFELPADHDAEYHYRPRPTYSAPITKHMFRHYFYGCYDSGTLSHRLHACMPLAPSCRIRNPAAELLEFLPKRDRPAAAATQSDKVEVCYGLVARERRSFFRVVLYLCLIIAPGLWFVFAWLFVWGDRGDLQDATVPLTLELALLSVLWAAVYSGNDVRKDYGDGA